MSEKKDVYSDVKGQMRLSERIAAFFPGFRGYKEKEMRRESDRLIRNHLNLKLLTAKTDLRAISQKLADRRYFDVMTDMDRLLAKMDRIVEKINHASYGYTGLFDAVKVKEEALDRMMAFDSQLIDDIRALAAEIDAFRADLNGGVTANLKTQIQNVTGKLESLEDTFDKREEVILGVN
jgi:translation initiation factor 2 gamma subunit (eIF-2gamma)